MSNHVDRPIVVITGSSGLIGRRVVKELCDDYFVVGLDNEQPDESFENMATILCDLTDDNSIADAFRRIKDEYGSRLASVIHLAAYYDFSGTPSPLYEQLTVEGTRRVLQQLLTFEDVGQFVFSSSLLVMKPSDGEHVLTEKSPTQAEWEYPESKLQAEEAIVREHGEIPAVILRIAGVYDDDCHSIPIGQQISRIYERELESHFFPGDTEHGQSFVHLDDLAACVRQTVESRGKLDGHEIFLIGEPRAASYEQLQDKIGQALWGEDWATIRIPKSVAKVGAWAKDAVTSEDEFIKPWMIDLADADYRVSILKAQATLGWEPKHQLLDDVDTMVGRLRLDPQRWYRINGLEYPEEVARSE